MMNLTIVSPKMTQAQILSKLNCHSYLSHCETLKDGRIKVIAVLTDDFDGDRFHDVYIVDNNNFKCVSECDDANKALEVFNNVS